MNRIAFGLQALGLAVVLVLALVLSWGLRELANRELLDHRIVAERIFDEGERRLTVFVEREENRPFTHYRYFYVPADLVAGSLGVARSPLAGTSTEAFVSGYAQLDPDGSVHSPLQPVERNLAQQCFGWTVDDSVRQFCDDVGDWAEANAQRLLASLGHRAGVVSYLHHAASGLDASAPSLPPLQTAGRAPGMHASNLNVKGVFSARSRSSRRVRIPAQSAYHYKTSGDSLLTDQLLRGDAESSDASLAMIGNANNLLNARQHIADADTEMTDAEALYEVMDPEEAFLQTDITLGQLFDTDQSDPANDTVQLLFDDIHAGLGVYANQAVEITVDPFIGLQMNAEQYSLWRTVQVQNAAYMQGIVIDVPLLVGDIERTLLAGTELRDKVHFSWRLGEDAVLIRSGDRRDETAYYFEHRFAPPFEDLHVRLGLAPLADKTAYGRGWLIALALAIGASLLLGFWAIGRMVGTRIAFAKRRSDFVAAVTHELRTPLTSIRMYGEMLRDGMVPSDEGRAKCYRTITAEGERLSRLIDNVLELGRVERDEVTVDLQPLPLVPLVEEVFEILAPHAENAGFVLRLEQQLPAPVVRADRDKLLQVLVNLIDNAMKFSIEAERKEVVLGLSARAGALRLSVRDYGPGVPAEMLPRLREPFFRGERELTRRTKGTGIGLSLVDAFVTRMGGEVALRNHPEGGFEVSFRLPLLDRG